LERLAVTAAKHGKPVVALMRDYSLWLLNPTEAEMEVRASELCGFGTGSYEETVVGTLAMILRKFGMNYFRM